MSKRSFPTLLLTLLAVAPVWAQTTIDQAKALAGGITAGDAPGFPVTLSATGSYKLTSNLVVPGNTNGIVITAPNVTLDLNGYSVSGPVNCVLSGGQLVCAGPIAGGFRGISTTANVEGTTIRNGHVRGFAESGINITAGIVEDVQAESNHGFGIVAGGTEPHLSARISGVRVRTNHSAGILSRHGLIERAIASNNGTGIAACRVSVIDSVVDSNLSTGLEALAGCPPPALKGTVLQDNGGSSISGAARSLGGNLVDGVAF